MKTEQHFFLILVAIFFLMATSIAHNPPPTQLPMSITVDGGQQLHCPGCDMGVRFRVEVKTTNVATNVMPAFSIELTVDDGTNSVSAYQTVVSGDFSQIPGTFGSFLEKAYTATYDIDVDLILLCGLDNHIDATVTARMVTGGGVLPYADLDVCNYRQTGDLFSCEVFSNIPCRGSCRSADFNSASSDVSISCSREDFDIRREQITTPDFTKPFGVSPNPFVDRLDLQWSQEEPIRRIELMDIQGRSIRQWLPQANEATAGQLHWNIAGLNKGIYFLQIETKNRTETMKLLKL